MLREHRLYQSDRLMRFYDYTPSEVAAAADDATGMMLLGIDRKPVAPADKDDLRLLVAPEAKQMELFD